MDLMSMSQVSADQEETAMRARLAAVEPVSLIETAVAEIDAIDALPFGNVGKSLDRIRELLVRAHRILECTS
jgi:hypothetical protein